MNRLRADPYLYTGRPLWFSHTLGLLWTSPHSRFLSFSRPRFLPPRSEFLPLWNSKTCVCEFGCPHLLPLSLPVCRALFSRAYNPLPRQDMASRSRRNVSGGVPTSTGAAAPRADLSSPLAERRAKRHVSRGAVSRGASSSRAAPPPPPPPAPPAVEVHRRGRPLIPPRYVDFRSLESVEPQIEELFATQDMTSFLANHHHYYPELVREFYDSLRYEGLVMRATVRGMTFAVSDVQWAFALNLGLNGAFHRHFQFDEAEAIRFMIDDDPSPFLAVKKSLNANTFPPMQRIIHHMITTLIYPKGGSRNEVTMVHKFIFHCLYNGIQMSIPQMMMYLINDVNNHPNRSLPYATQLTALFRQNGVPLEGEHMLMVKSSNVYNKKNLKKFMKFQLVGGVLERPVGIRVISSSEDEESTDEDEAEEEEEQEEFAEEDFAPEPAALGEHGAHRAVDQSWFEEQFASIRGEVHQVGSAVAALGHDFAELRVGHERLQSQMDTQSAILRDMWGYLRPSSSQPPPE